MKIEITSDELIFALLYFKYIKTPYKWKIVDLFLQIG